MDGHSLPYRVEKFCSKWRAISHRQAQSLHVALWNLDSQDWNNHVDVNGITNRMITLMLLKRHGVLLFHDVHPKAKVALPIIFKELGNSVEWGDCHQLVSG